MGKRTQAKSPIKTPTKVEGTLKTPTKVDKKQPVGQTANILGANVWKFFTKDPARGVAVCNYCDKAMNSAFTVNLRYHLKNVHNIHDPSKLRYCSPMDLPENI